MKIAHSCYQLHITNKLMLNNYVGLRFLQLLQNELAELIAVIGFRWLKNYAILIPHGGVWIVNLYRNKFSCKRWIVHAQRWASTTIRWLCTTCLAIIYTLKWKQQKLLQFSPLTPRLFGYPYWALFATRLRLQCLDWVGIWQKELNQLVLFLWMMRVSRDFLCHGNKLARSWAKAQGETY